MHPGDNQGTISANDETAAGGVFSKFELASCREGQTVDTLNNNGTLTILKSNTAVSAIGVEVTTAVGGVSCVYGFGTSSTLLGTATNTKVEGADRVTLAIKANLPKISGGFFCASPASWTANYVFTTPTTSFLD